MDGAALKKFLKDSFGYRNFKPYQREVISDVLEGKDAFAVLPTGGGKSLCYQLPALKFKGTALVVSPLIALMKDQVDALKKKGIAAEHINSSLKDSEIEAAKEKALAGKIKMLYLI